MIVKLDNDVITAERFVQTNIVAKGKKLCVDNVKLSTANNKYTFET